MGIFNGYILCSVGKTCWCSVSQLCPTLCNPMECSTPTFPVLHDLPEFAQTLVHWVGDAIQPSHPLLSPLLLSSIFSSIRVFSNELALRMRWPKYCSFSFSVSPSVSVQGWFSLGLTGLISSLSKRLSRVFSSTIVWRHDSLTLILFYCPALTSVHVYWKTHSFDYMDLCRQSNVLAF